jgi:aspartyl-tRNA(Asn)/glutamyl-tRNA(Gln) amidotransferase subunit C
VSAELSGDDVRKVAHLARLELSEAEVAMFTEQLRSVLEHARDIEALDIHSLEPTAHPFGLVNVLRADEVRPSVDRQEVLSQAPEPIEGRFGVPRIMGDAP